MKLGMPARPVRVTDPETETQMLDQISRWLKKDVEPHVMKMEHDDIYPRQMVEQMKAFGLFGAVIDPTYGGLGLSASTYAKIVTRISETWMSLTGIFNSHLMMAVLVKNSATTSRKTAFCRAWRAASCVVASASPNRMPALICRRSNSRQKNRAGSRAITIW